MIEINTEDLRLVYQDENALRFVYSDGMIIRVEFTTIDQARDTLQSNWYSTKNQAFHYQNAVRVTYTYVS
jgi:hypothetical protein